MTRLTPISQTLNVSDPAGAVGLTETFDVKNNVKSKYNYYLLKEIYEIFQHGKLSHDLTVHSVRVQLKRKLWLEMNNFEISLISSLYRAPEYNPLSDRWTSSSHL